MKKNLNSGFAGFLMSLLIIAPSVSNVFKGITQGSG
jgi:hypothetical protein